MTDAWDASIVLKHDIRNITVRNMKIKIPTDSETILNVIIRNECSTERSLMIDIKATRKAYNEAIIIALTWIRREHSLADAMRKAKILPQLVETMKTVNIKYKVEQSANRSI